MTRHIADLARARGALAVDPKSLEGASFPERVCAWDEDATTLAIDAARALPPARVGFACPGIDLETLSIALDLAEAHLASDPVAMARAARGPALAFTAPDAQSIVAALVVDGAGAEPAAPRDVSAPPRVVSALRALHEGRLVPPVERHPDTPIGTYVPWSTWIEDLPARLRLLAQRCARCGRVAYPPRAACPGCAQRAFEPLALPDTARVYAMTRIGRGGAPSEFALEQTQVGAYWVGVVEWPEQGVRVTARLWGFDDEGPRIGDAVRPVVRRLFEQEGRVRYGTKFTPAPSRQG